jgi:hypothetical protein
VSGVALLVAGGVAGVSYASIPDAGTGLIHSCYSTTTGAMRVNNVAKTPSCHTGEAALTWYKGAPAPTSVSGQVATDSGIQFVAHSSGLQVSVTCEPFINGTSVVSAEVTPIGNAGFWGWGTGSDDNTTVRPAHISAGADGAPRTISDSESGTTMSLDVVATASGGPTKYTRFDISVVEGSMCNYHIMIIPSS